MSKKLILRGLTWDHPRACDGLFAETHRFNALSDDIAIVWDVHSLRGFEATPIVETADKYDLIILDHPFMGDAAAGGALLNLQEHLDAADLAALQESYIGLSFKSYEYGGGLWALPIDAASQVAVCRPDLLDGAVPATFDEAIAFGQRGGLGLSMANPHAFMNYLGIASCLGADISGNDENFLPQDIAVQALSILRRLARHIPDAAFDWSSIDLLEAMAHSDDVTYCPFVFSFNSYAQAPAAGHHRLRYCDSPTNTANAATVLGGTGLAVSSSTRDIGAAVKAALHLVKEGAQIRMTEAGGQAAHRSVWSPTAQKTINGTFFDECRTMQENAVLRPRWPGYIKLQNFAGQLLQTDCLDQAGDGTQTIRDIEDYFRSARAGELEF
ncbi:extracellular solute-binding protein [Pararhizobium sp. IMCC21322]|uniref:extracellular solute-binding protein n=1 Tax=Pararhizobium sp. IMCC21322 TaxID=3067903 RepID=UPI00274215FB|nr:extracellular solute-binding protein [Pararhizobium sp. IMCC21322]